MVRPMARCFVTLTLVEEDEEEIPERLEPPTEAKTRSRTTSLPPKPQRKGSSSSIGERMGSPRSPTTDKPTMTRRPSSLRENGNARHSSTPGGEKRTPRPPPVRRSTLGPAHGDCRAPPVPFFLSPIHKPSTHPRWADLEPGDFAQWLTVPEAAGTQLQLNVWYEDRGRWKRLPDVGGRVDLHDLVPIPKDGVLPPNTIEWTFSNQPKHVFYLPVVKPEPKAVDDKNVVERSLRETRMKKGATVSALHQSVNRLCRLTSGSSTSRAS